MRAVLFAVFFVLSITSIISPTLVERRATVLQAQAQSQGPGLQLIGRFQVFELVTGEGILNVSAAIYKLVGHGNAGMNWYYYFVNITTIPLYSWRTRFVNASHTVLYADNHYRWLSSYGPISVDSSQRGDGIAFVYLETGFTCRQVINEYWWDKINITDWNVYQNTSGFYIPYITVIDTSDSRAARASWDFVYPYRAAPHTAGPGFVVGTWSYNIHTVSFSYNVTWMYCPAPGYCLNATYGISARVSCWADSCTVIRQ